MRHRKKINHLSRKKAHRDSMLSNMAVSLIKHKRIHTTVAKAKALRSWVEPLLTKSKEDNTHSRRTVFSYLQDKEAVTELFREISKKIAERPGGYTRILKTGNRLGDSANMCYIELVDYNEAMLKSSEEKKQKSGRRRRSSKKDKGKDNATEQIKVPSNEEKNIVQPEAAKPVDTIADVNTNETFEDSNTSETQNISEDNQIQNNASTEANTEEEK